MVDIEPAVLLGAVAGGNRVRNEKKAGRAFNSNVLNRRVRLAEEPDMQDRRGGVLVQLDECTKTDRPVTDVL